MLDIARDPRWGRIAEGPGEDPLVAAKFAEAKIRSSQGRGRANLKRRDRQTFLRWRRRHGGRGRDYAAVDISERALHEVYLPPFLAAGCAAIMPDFNSVAGVPMTAHVGLLRGFLRTKLGYEGVIISDYHAIAELTQHGIADDLVDAAATETAAFTLTAESFTFFDENFCACRRTG